ncbi:MAG: VCBS repeat-containing protein [Pseudomonadales bacterium]|nr:VCBS repeat-containing protein [Pseudomonadales bacterium]
MIARIQLFLLAALTTNIVAAQELVGDTLTKARSVDGMYISWREHIIDDPESAGFALSGSDGLVMADLDKDGFEDIVSVHESDSEYDSTTELAGFTPPPAGHVRVAFGSDDPDEWVNITIAEGTDSPAPEDAVIADLNNDGYPDVIAAAELSHLIYLQNPGRSARSEEWPRLILPQTEGRGSYIRVFAGDLDADGIPEITAPNKGAQRPGPSDYARSTPVELHVLKGDPLLGDSWQRIELGNYSIPQNSETVDLDNDGDLDIVVGTRGEGRLSFFENLGDGNLDFVEHAIGIYGARMAGFNLEYVDLSNDGRLDIVGSTGTGLAWIEQPENIDNAWNAYRIGDFAPDSMTGMEFADIDQDGDMDLIGGSYSRGPRTGDGDVEVRDALGRIGWFENPGDAKAAWTRHDISRRKRGMYDKFIARDMDNDGDIDFVGTRGNSYPYDGVYWLEQVRTAQPVAAFTRARAEDSEEMPLPN